MKVKDLIAKLKKQPQDMEVVTDLHSEYSLVHSVKRIVGYDNGGYVSRPYNAEDKPSCHGYVYVGVEEEALDRVKEA